MCSLLLYISGFHYHYFERIKCISIKFVSVPALSCNSSTAVISFALWCSALMPK